jgi:hypothetical protein
MTHGLLAHRWLEEPAPRAAAPTFLFQCEQCHADLVRVTELPRRDGVVRLQCWCRAGHCLTRAYIPNPDGSVAGEAARLLARFSTPQPPAEEETPMHTSDTAASQAVTIWVHPLVQLPIDAHHVYHRMGRIFGECLELSMQKGKDYGSDEDPFANVRNSEAFGFPAWVGIAMRAQDKLSRMASAARNLISKGETALANESLEDAFRDMVNYGVIALVTMAQDKEKEGRCGG